MTGTRTWIALLRGINVGGHRKVIMADLREMCTDLGCAAVRSYIQSGNVVFRAQGDEKALATALHRGIDERFGFDVPVVLRDLDALDAVVAGNPFLSAGGADTSRLHVAFLQGRPSAAVLEEYGAFRLGHDELRLVGREAYLHTPQGLGRSKLTPAFLERAMGSLCTTRNWRTVNTLLEMARQA